MITCWRCQRVVSVHIDAGVALPDWARGHIASCPRCQAFHESGLVLARRLSASAGGERREPSPFLPGKIMSAIRSREDARQPAIRRWGWALAAGAACLVAASTLWLQRARPVHSLAQIPAPAKPVLNATTPAPTAQMDQWLKTSEAPLENETQLVLDDAKSAMNSLAKSLLPNDLLSSAKNGVR